MNGSFSLLRQWLTSPTVVGTFTILGAGIFVSLLFLFVSYQCDEMDFYGWAMFFGIGAACIFVATVVCAVVFNDWARTVV